MYMEMYIKRIIQYSLLATTVLLTMSFALKGEWTEAIKICNSTGGIFSNNSFDTGHKHWGNKYILQTSFLSYKGCHTTYGPCKKHLLLDGPDLVNCYQHCQNISCPSELWIGIKGKYCCCGCGKEDSAKLRSPSLCHIDCSLQKDFAKCGGYSHISIYMEVQVQNDNDETKNCVNINCNGIPSFGVENCEDKENSLCGVIWFGSQGPVSWKAAHSQTRSWIITMKSCYTFFGYLLDDKDHNYCENHTHTGQKYWTSIHRYRKVLSIYDTDVAHRPDLCEVVQNGISSFESCKQNMNYRCTSEVTPPEVLNSSDSTTNKIIINTMTTPNSIPTERRRTSVNVSKTSIGSRLTVDAQGTTVPPFLISSTSSFHTDYSLTHQTSNLTKLETNSMLLMTETKTMRDFSTKQRHTHSVVGEIKQTTNSQKISSIITSQMPGKDNETMSVHSRSTQSNNLVSIIAGSVSSLVVLIMAVTGIICWKRKTSRISSNKSNEEDAQLRLRHLERNCEETLPVEYATPDKLTSRYQSVHKETRNEKSSNSNAANVGVTYAIVDKRKSLIKSEQDERTYTNYPAMKEHMQKFNSGRSNENEENYYVASMDETYDELRGKRARIGGRNNSDDLYSHTVSSNTEDGDCEYSYSTHGGCNSGDVSEHYGHLSATSGL